MIMIVPGSDRHQGYTIHDDLTEFRAILFRFRHVAILVEQRKFFQRQSVIEIGFQRLSQRLQKTNFFGKVESNGRQFEKQLRKINEHPIRIVGNIVGRKQNIVVLLMIGGVGVFLRSSSRIGTSLSPNHLVMV